jgi:beta-xylosidase
VVTTFALFSAFAIAQVSNFGHPLVPDLIADPSITEIDGTFYLNATTDGAGAGLATSGLPVTWKSRDFLNWSFSGSIFPSDFDAKYWAPSGLILRNTRYYLFPTLNGKITAVVADSPNGPFHALDGKDIASRTGWRPFPIRIGKPIDADVFVDDDGATYMVWAQRGFGKLLPDLSGFDGEQSLIQTKRDGYSEGPMLFKRKGIYYYLYTLGGSENYRYAYMMSRISPHGPWQAPEDDVIAQTDYQTGVFGPGHGCVVNPKGSEQWYFVYLEYGRGGTNRQVWANKMYFNRDGTIQPVQLTAEGGGAVRRNPRTDEPNIALRKTATASSTRPEYRVLPRAEPRLNRVENYAPDNALDGSNGTRWLASDSDTAPWYQLDLGKIRNINRTELYFVKPTAGQAYRLEFSIDGKTWQPYGVHQNVVVQSPHTDVKSVRARYLRVVILQGTPGLWEFKVFKDNATEEGR